WDTQPEASIEPLTDQASAAERHEQRDTTDHGRQHHRQRRERAYHAAPGKRDARIDPCERNAEQQAECRGRDRDEQGKSQREERLFSEEIAERGLPRHAIDEPGKRQCEERDADRGEGGDREWWARRSHGFENPNSASSFWPSSDRRYSTYAFASRAFFVSFTTAIGYRASTCCCSGMSTPPTFAPADLTSVTYTMPASASPR